MKQQCIAPATAHSHFTYPAFVPKLHTFLPRSMGLAKGRTTQLGILPKLTAAGTASGEKGVHGGGLPAHVSLALRLLPGCTCAELFSRCHDH